MLLLLHIPEEAPSFPSNFPLDLLNVNVKQIGVCIIILLHIIVLPILAALAKRFDDVKSEIVTSVLENIKSTKENSKSPLKSSTRPLNNLWCCQATYVISVESSYCLLFALCVVTCRVLHGDASSVRLDPLYVYPLGFLVMYHMLAYRRGFAF